MGCGFGYEDDFEKCDSLINEYEYLLDLEETEKYTAKKLERHNELKEEIKSKIRSTLESINEYANDFTQIDRLQKLNEKYQSLLTEESKIRNDN